MVKQTYRWILGIMVLMGVLMALPIGVSMAQVVVVPADAVGQVELVGLVEAMTVDSITINQQVIDISAAQVNTVIELAAAVKVEGWLLVDGSMTAREVSALAAGDVLPGEIEVVGVLTAMDGTSITVSGLTIDITTAQITDVIVVGDTVKVHASFDAAGALVAREVALDTPDSSTGDDSSADDNSNDNSADTEDNSNDNSVTDEDFELRGTLEAIGDGYITVAGQTINTLQAEIKGQLQVGALVKVHLSLVNGELVAQEVELASQGQSSDDDGEDDDNDNAAVVIPADCVPALPAGWTTYVIQSGDTLSGIAAGSGSSVGELAVANCIQDPRFVVVGMEIFVPQTPDTSLMNSNDNSDDHVDDSNDDNGDDDSHDDNDDDHGDDDSGDDGDDDHGNDNS